MNSKNDIILTVFTPAYNRAHTLVRTYESLRAQSNKDFLWLIIDDGSTDNTAEMVKEWQKSECEFEIRYIYKENGGMHTAHNVAYANISTLLNVCIDSDDMLAEDAVDNILKKWDIVKDKGYAGIIGLDADFNGNIIGKDFPDDMEETTLSGYYSGGGRGDKKLVYRTDIIKKYPEYPVFDNEKYVSLAYKYLLIDQDYKLAVIRTVLCNVEYQSNGSSNSMFLQYLKNPKGFAFWRTVKMQYPESFKRLIMDCIHYCSSSQIAKNRNYIRESPRKLMTVICTPLGLILTAWIKNRAKKASR